MYPNLPIEEVFKSMARNGMRKWLSALFVFTLLTGTLYVPPTLVPTAEASVAPSFHTGLENQDAIQPTWIDESELSGNVSRPETKVTDEMSHKGINALLYAGQSTGAGRSYAYNKVFETNLAVNADTTVSYWIYPQSRSTGEGGAEYHGKNSMNVAIDLAFDDGTYLHETEAKDQYGIGMHPEAQGNGGKLFPDKWNFVTANIGEAAKGKTIKRILVSYEQPGNAGTYRGFIDDIQVWNAGFDPTVYADPMLGTANNELDIIGFGGNRGNTFPGAVVPFGMIQWSPDTGYNDLGSGKAPLGSGYDYDKKSIAGFSLTHIDGPGCDIAQNVPFLPIVGDLRKSPATNFEDYGSSYRRENETAIPGYYSVLLDRYRIQAEFAPTERAGIGRFTYPATDKATMIINTGINASGVRDAFVQIDKENRMVTGWVNAGGFCGSKGSGGTLKEDTNNYTVYFAAEFSHPFAEVGTYKSGVITKDNVEERSEKPDHRKVGAYVKFDTSEDQVVQVKAAISYTNIDNAKLNLKTEIPGWNFDEVSKAARAKWKKALSSILVSGGTEKHKRMFYSFMYHAFVHPSVYNDANGDYRGFDQKIYNTGGKYTHYSAFSGWDVYRTQMQLIAMLFPDVGSDFAQSLVNSAKSRNGFLPKWSIANSETNIMNGDPASATIANMYAFGARDFDLQAAMEIMDHHASTPSSLNGRFNLEDYLALGYIPIERGGWVTGYSVEYAVADYAIAQFAKAIGDGERYHTYMSRAQNWRNSFEDGYIRPRKANGEFEGNFDPASEHGFQEANSAQYTWVVAFDYNGLFEKMGGIDAARDRLDFFFTELNGGSRKPYSFLGNQPSYGVPWAYNFAGQPWKTQDIARRAMFELFHDGPAGMIGNNDLGAGSAWFILASLGLYPEINGIGGFSLNAPLFEEALIRLGDRKTFTIRGHNNQSEEEALRMKYIDGVTLNGQTYASTWLPYEYMTDGGVLSFAVSDRANMTWGTGPVDPEHPSDSYLGSQIVNNGLYRLVNKATGQALEIPDEAAENGTAVQTGAVAATNRQVWSMNGNPYANYTIANVSAGLALGLDTELAKPVVRQADANHALKWEALATGDGYYMVKNVETKKWLKADDTGAVAADETNDLTDAHQWKFVQTLKPGATYRIVNANGGKALEANEEGQLQLGAYYTGADNQRWTVRQAGDGGFRFVNAASRNVLSLANGSSANSTRAVTEVPDDAKAYQTWDVLFAYQNAYRITNAALTNAGGPLHLGAQGTADAAPVVVTGTNAPGNAQLWKMIEVMDPFERRFDGNENQDE